MTDYFVPAQGDPYYINDALFCEDRFDRLKELSTKFKGSESMIKDYMAELHQFALRSTKNYSTEITEDFGANLHDFTSFS